MTKSFQIKKILLGILALITVMGLLAGCSLAPEYVDPETGNISADAARISLLKKSSIKTIYSTNRNVFYLMNNANVLVSGANDKGLLGQGNTDEYDYVVHAKLPERIKLVSGNDSFAIAVSDTNNVYIWGDLTWWKDDPSLVTNENNLTYKKFSFKEIVIDVSVSSSHIAVLTKSGHVYTLGYNLGQLGYDISEEQSGRLYSEFRLIESEIFFSKIETNSTATYMLSNNGAIYGCSANEYYELGYIKELAEINQIRSNLTFTAISTAGYNLFALSSNGNVYACGQNTNGVLGLNSSLTSAAALTEIPFTNSINVKSICGCDYTNTVSFVTDTGDVYACGTNSSGSLYTDSTDVAVRIPTLVKIGKISELYGMGTTKFYIDQSGRLYTYGDNSYCQMPLSESTTKSTFVAPIRIYANIK